MAVRRLGVRSESMESTPKVSIVIITYNCRDLTRKCLNTLRDTVTIPHEIVILDNHSEDGVAEDLKSLTPPFRVILNQTRNRYAPNANQAAREARGEILCLLNNDTLLTPGWLEPMVELLESLPQAGIIGNIQIDPRTRMIDHAGMFFCPDGLPRHARKRRQRLPVEDWLEWSCVTAACLLIRRETFFSVGGYDEEYRNSCEDSDLCVRLKLKGYRHYVSNRVPIFHRVGSSPQRHQWDLDNQALFQRKWAAVTSKWAQNEWAVEYFRRYARECWKLNPTEVLRALYYLGRHRQWRKAAGAVCVGRPGLSREIPIPSGRD